MRAILTRYRDKFDETDALAQKVYVDPETATDEFVDFLTDMYSEGLAATGLMLGAELEVKRNELYSALDKSYEGVSIYNRLLGHIRDGDMGALKTLIESEGHRTYVLGGFDGARQFPRRVKKTWVTMKDSYVRDSHKPLEGVSVRLDEKFRTAGDEAYAPGLFTNPRNNANCRCILTYDFE